MFLDRELDDSWASANSFRIPANENLARDVSELLPRPVGRPSHNTVTQFQPYKLFGGGTMYLNKRRLLVLLLASGMSMAGFHRRPPGK